jgi:hypothetical protein
MSLDKSLEIRIGCLFCIAWLLMLLLDGVRLDDCLHIIMKMGNGVWTAYAGM